MAAATELYPVPPVPLWLQPTMPDPAFQVKFRNKGGDHWVSNVGPQTWTLLCPYDEILIGGRRGGSKTTALIAWFAMGDMSLAPDDPVVSNTESELSRPAPALGFVCLSANLEGTVPRPTAPARNSRTGRVGPIRGNSKCCFSP
jgi:hypothetical protein